MRLHRWLCGGALVALLLGGCATAPPATIPAIEDEMPAAIEPPIELPQRAPLIESPPLEPVEPSPQPAPVFAAPFPRPATEPPAAATPPATAPIVTPPVIAVPVPVEPPEDSQMVSLLADLSRYGGLPSDDLRRELAGATQALARQRNDANRVRLAVLYTLVRSTPQDDLRALQLFDNVAKSGGTMTPVKHLAAVLTFQVGERQRALREEQLKADQAVRKLDQLLEMERTLLRERVRSGGGGGGGGAGGGGSGGSGGH